MKTSESNKVVQYLLTQVTYMLLAKSPVKDHLQKTSVAHEARLRAQLTDDEFAPIAEMRNCIATLVEKIARCKDTTQLELTHSYLRDLVEGKVMIAEADNSGEVIGYSPNQ